MSRIVSKDNRKQIKGYPGVKRPESTGNDFGQAEEQFEELYRFLEERYGYPKEKAKEEVNRRIRR